MTDREIDQLLRGIDPVSRRGLPGADETLLEEIMSTTRHAGDPRSFRNRIIGAVAVAAALTAAIGIPVALNGRADENPPYVGPRPTEPTQTTQIRYASAVLEAAERNPRLLVKAPGWEIVSVTGFLTDEGEITYQKGDDQWIKLYWVPSSFYADAKAKRDQESPSEQLPGAVGEMTVYATGGEAYDIVVPPRPADAAYATLKVMGKAEMQAVAAGLERADVKTWLASLPPEVVRPANTSEAVDRVLQGVPLPPGFDRTSLVDLGTNTEYHLGARVLDRVLCGWMARYEGGDATARTDAIEAVGTSRTWPILQRMDAEGDYPDFVWELAVQMRTGTVPEGVHESLECS